MTIEFKGKHIAVAAHEWETGEAQLIKDLVEVDNLIDDGFKINTILKTKNAYTFILAKETSS